MMASTLPVLSQVYTLATQILTGPPALEPGSIPSPNETKIGSGHDSDAIRILEQAFEITPNITQAEKFRLAEVTGLQPRQVTVWFQNRRNRKGRKGPALKRAVQSPTDHSPPKKGTLPPSSPTHDFTLSEKKRKSYGALGRASSDYVDSDSDSPTSLLKKPRVLSSCSEDSGGSVSSIDQIMELTPWNTPSSRSTSSSSASSSQSDLCHSPRKPHNLFDYIKPKREGKANSSMPALTFSTPQKLVNQGLAPTQQSPFTSNVQGDATFRNGGLSLGDLYLSMGEAFDRELRESVQRVLDTPGFDAGSYRSVSSSSWDSEQTTTDGDGWLDEDEFDTSLDGRNDMPVEVVAHGQPTLMHSAFQSVNTAGLGQEESQPALLQSVAAHEAESEAETFSTYFLDDESLDLIGRIAPSGARTLLPTSSPFCSQPQHPLGMVDSDANLPLPFADLDLEMTELQSFLDTDLFASSLPSSQQIISAAGSGSSDGTKQGSVSPDAQFFMNFDMSSNAFSLV
ncbi:hypothetical protein EX895_000796 [Sporisorium graminicola]|uniref:Homeobox domain-containing protein n=1 Tax=Sporisorium graminicola TaxID=280036 RepID=A0A4U7L4B3_9BASI|nr:hypothetical protein EX895_000796 [Sporisorium graminicola]TKY90798.1 hypothetical protein EX895_000796 [Sporisorium graminicola]